MQWFNALQLHYVCIANGGATGDKYAASLQTIAEEQEEPITEVAWTILSARLREHAASVPAAERWGRMMTGLELQPSLRLNWKQVTSLTCNLVA